MTREFSLKPEKKKSLRELFNDPAVVISAGFTFITFCIALFFTLAQHSRDKQLFAAQNRPLVDVIPEAIIQGPGTTNSVTIFRVLNYSGFDAFNLAVDLKYEISDQYYWTTQWGKARTESEAGRLGVTKGFRYDTRLPVFLEKLPAGKAVEQRMALGNALDLESDVCKRGNSGLPVSIRASWNNSSGHVFDEIHSYKLICTKDLEGTKRGKGRSFTFTRNGIIPGAGSDI